MHSGQIMQSELEEPKSESDLKDKIELTKAELDRISQDDEELESQIFQISSSIYEELVQGTLRDSKNRGILDQDLQVAMNLLRVSRDELWVKDLVKALAALDAWETQYRAKYELAKQVRETVERRLGSSRIEEMLKQRREIENERRLLKKDLEEQEARYRDFLGSPHQSVSRISG